MNEIEPSVGHNPQPTGTTCTICKNLADGTCTSCGKFFCGAHRAGTCGNCYDAMRNVFGIQALGLAVIAGVIGYIAWTLPFGLSEESRDMAPLPWVFAASAGLASLILFWLTFRKFPPDRPTDERISGGTGVARKPTDNNPNFKRL